MKVAAVPFVAFAVAAAAGLAAVKDRVQAADEPVAGVGFAEFLTDKGIDAAGRRDLIDASAWDAAAERAAIRVLARLSAPAELERRWAAAARELGAAPEPPGDELVRVRGRATFVAPWTLEGDLAALAGRPQFDVVRIVAEAGPEVDVLVAAAPRGWPRWKPFDEPAAVVGLPLSTRVGPRPGPAPADRAAWPDAAPALLLAAGHVGWYPLTPAGLLGMDYALFDTVADGRKLEPGDADAFFALLAAAGRSPQGAGGPPTDILPLIDPAQKWFAANRGAPVTVAGTAKRATRIAIDEPLRREEAGADHYWELFVFVDTPLLNVDGRQQDNYPLVCCVRELPEGMPTGDRISERVSVAGFGFKRYAYPLADLLVISSQGDRETKGERMETPLVIGRRAEWTPAPSTRGTTSTLSWIFGGLAAAVALVLAAGAWAMRRDARARARRARDELPDRIELPTDRG